MDCKKTEFNLDPNITYLNCAYMSPLMHSVEEAGIHGIKKKRQPNIISGEDFFSESDELRTEFAKLINSEQSNQCVVIPSVSYGMANVAKNLQLKKGDNIIVVGEQFPSNVYPWVEVAKKAEAEIITVPPPQSENERGKLWNEEILNAINSRTQLVACGHIHWADGTIFDLRSIRQKTFEVDAWLVIDGTQSLGAVPFDVNRLKPDALIAAGKSDHSGRTYNVGSGTTVSVNRLVDLLGGDKVHIPKRPGEPECTFADISRIQLELGWKPKVSIERGVAELLKNIDYWDQAPVWTPENIAEATQDWFRYLGDNDAS